MNAHVAELEAPPVSATDPSNSEHSFPLGATVLPGGVNFSVFSRRATRAELLLFDRADAVHPTRVLEFDAAMHRTHHYWHVFVPGIGPGQIYAYRVIGPLDPEHGLGIDRTKGPLDPYARSVVLPDRYSRNMASRYGENDAITMKSVAVDPDAYDWESDAPLRQPFATTVIYEMHVAGFTRHPSSGVAAAAPVVTSQQYRVGPRSVAAVFVRAPHSEPTPEVADAGIANPASA